ncbi:ParB/RepB/Spo0J family partition protein [Meiothermus sp. CFH 77666]|uniref:ParB/RepB/Spo0J family partition protein n=1 Tax=Meiothermus sp. CFH 77666 TaxID=2817942 RepID=UPI001FB0555E|nr:ParB/RepB/Spo0J family partition protein [Meiothermus sp. CFH 77666]
MTVKESSLPLTALSPTAQPRKRFEKLEELAASVKERGVLQPLLVRPLGDGQYAIIAGERRYRAAELAGLTEVPVVILEVDEATAHQIALVENLQREDLNPYEETLGILALLEMRLEKSREEVVGLLRQMKNAREGRVRDNVVPNTDAVQVEEIFQGLGRLTWESFVQHRLPLLNLPEDLKAALEEGVIPYTTALELKKVRDKKARKNLLKEARLGLSLRELKERVRALLQKEASPLPRHRAVASRLAKVNLEALPAEKRARVEEMLEELERLLGE